MRILIQLSWFFRHEWRRYAIAFVALITIAGLTMLPPWITGQVVDAIASQQLTWPYLLEQLALLLVIGLVVYLLRILWRRQLYSASYLLAAILRSRIHDHLTHLSPRFFQQHQTGDLMARATNDVSAVEMTAGDAVLAMVDGVLTGLIVLIVMATLISWKLTLLALLPWPIMGYFMWRFGNQMHDAFTDAQQQFSTLNNHTQESIAGIRHIKAFGQQDQILAQFHDVTTSVSRANLEVAKVESKYDPVIFVTVGSSFLLAIAGGAWWIAHQSMTLGELTAFTLYLGYLIWPMFAYGWTLNLLERGKVAYERIEQLLTTAPAIADDGRLSAPATTRLDVKIDSFCYPGNPSSALHDVNFTLPAGDTLGIVGPTGSGKTTLLQLLLRSYEGEQIRIELDHQALAAYPLATLRAQFGVVPQDPFLFSLTVAENIALGRPEASVEEIRQAAQLASIDDDIMGFVHQYDTLVGERGITLSGGQKQRIAIARALLLDPPVLVLDDALSAVDVGTERMILQHLRHARAGKSTVIVCHRLSAVTHADQVLVLRHGTITEHGSHTQLMQLDGWYAQMYRYQQIAQALDD